jgi:uncharacterized protein (TIGR02246 family)
MIAVLILAQKAVSQKMDELKAKIEKINKEMAQAMLEGNSEKGLAFYADDAISMPSNEKMSEGKEAIKKANTDMMKSGINITSFETKTLKVNTCDKMITEIGTYKISLLMPGVEGTTEDVGKYVTMWEKQADGSLLIKLEIWNSDSNPMAQ